MKTSIKNSEIWRIVYPIMVGNLAQTLIALVDTAFLGRLGEVELGAASMAGIYYYFFTTLAWGFSIGVQVIVARRFGEGNYKQIGFVMKHGLLFMSLFAISLFVLISSFTDIIMRTFVASDDVYRVAVTFIEYRRFGILFACFNFLFRSYYIGLSFTRSITYSTILMTVVNVIFDAVLIFGSPFNAPMGVAGAAIASVMAEITATIFFITYTIMKSPYGVFVSFRGKFDMLLMKSILNISMPTMLQKFISFGSWLAFFLIVEKISERALAVTMVSRSVFMLLGVPVFAFAATANTVTSRLIGEGKSGEVRPSLIKILRFSWLFLIIPTIAVTFFPELCLSVYTNDPGIISDAVPILLLAGATQYAMALGMIYFDATSGTGHTSHALIMEFLVLIAYMFFAWYFGIHIKAGVFWVWVSEFIYAFSLSIVTVLYIRYYKWQNKSI